MNHDILENLRKGFSLKYLNLSCKLSDCFINNHNCIYNRIHRDINCIFGNLCENKSRNCSFGLNHNWEFSEVIYSSEILTDKYMDWWERNNKPGRPHIEEIS